MRYPAGMAQRHSVVRIQRFHAVLGSPKSAVGVVPLFSHGTPDD
jgi:hypothetical protein